MELDKKLKRVAYWLKIPVYLYIYREVDGPNQLNLSQRCFWVVFEPDGAISKTKSDCRFYISLFYNCSKGKGVFDRIIPEKGCNCQNPPPLSLLRNSQSKYIFIRHVFYYFMINRTNLYHVPFYYFVLTFYGLCGELNFHKKQRTYSFIICSSPKLVDPSWSSVL